MKVLHVDRADHVTVRAADNNPVSLAHELGVTSICIQELDARLSSEMRVWAVYPGPWFTTRHPQPLVQGGRGSRPMLIFVSGGLGAADPTPDDITELCFYVHSASAMEASHD